MDVYRTSERNFLSLLENIASDRELFVPADDHGEISYKNWKDLGRSTVHFPKNRIGTPPKVFFFPPKEAVSNFPSVNAEPERSKGAVFGLKACDLDSFKVLDNVFLDEEFVDPFYAIRRHDTLLISSDCYEIADTCFCNKVGGQPYPDKGFDINVTKTRVPKSYLSSSIRNHSRLKKFTKLTRDFSSQLQKGPSKKEPRLEFPEKKSLTIKIVSMFLKMWEKFLLTTRFGVN